MRERRNVEGVSAVRRVISVLFVCLFLMGSETIRPENSWAIGQIAYQNPEDIALGIAGSSSVLILGIVERDDPVPRWKMEAGERRLFGVDDLKIDGASLGVRQGGWGAFVSITHLATPVGSETLLTLEPLYFAKRFLTFAAGVNLSRLSMGDTPSVYLATVSVRLFARIVDGLAVGYTIENIRVGGETFPGADAAVHAVAFAGSPVCLQARLEVGRNGTVAVGISSRARLGRYLRAAAGYDDATGGLAGSVTVSLGTLGLRVGAELHPVLGVSQSLSLVLRSRGS